MRQTSRLAVPWRCAGSTHYSTCASRDVSGRSETEWPFQPRNAELASSGLRVSFAGVRDGPAQDPAADGTPIAVDDSALPAHRDLQSVLDDESARSAAASVAAATIRSRTAGVFAASFPPQAYLYRPARRPPTTRS